MAKRLREPRAKPGELKACWGKIDGDVDICYAWGEGTHKADGSLLHSVLGSPRMKRPDGPWDKTYIGAVDWEQSLLKELEARGYDLTTLKFSIQKKVP